MEWVRGAAGAEPVGQEQTERKAGRQSACLACLNETIHKSNLMYNNSTHFRFQQVVVQPFEQIRDKSQKPG
jgi:hypothetical protein